MTRRQDIVDEARSWRAVRWKHMGRSRSGLDCVGLVICTAVQLDLAEPEVDLRAYPRRPDGTFIDNFRKHMLEIKPADAGLGDVLIFADSGHPCHCGIRTEKHGTPAVIHAHVRRRQVIEEPLDQALSVIGRPIFAFTFYGLEDQ